MKESQTKPYDQFLHPFVFILKEGKEIQNDFLDYSLLLLQVNLTDVIPSPGRRRAKSSTHETQLLKK
jgi:hypothetical protein